MKGIIAMDKYNDFKREIAYREKNNENNNYVQHKKRRRKKSLFKSLVTLSLCAVVFGGVSGGTFYAINNMLWGREAFANNQTSNSLQTTEYTSSDGGLINTSYSSGHYSLNLDVSDIASEGLPSVVSVTNISVQEVENFFGRFGRNSRVPLTQETMSCGSGIIIDKGDTDLYMVTNYHVVEGATTLSVTFVDNETYEDELCGYDESSDIAVIKVSLNDLTDDTLSQISVINVGDSDDLVVGEQVVAIGNALGYGQSVTTGIVSAMNRSISSSGNSSATYIQTDAAINPGNSGGALLNMEGELVGINTAKIASSEVEGMGYAIPISQVMDLIQSFIG